MAKNRMAEVAKLLGLELGEEFEAIGIDGSEIGRYRFTEENLENWVAPDSEWMQEDATIADLLNGTYEIEKKTWKPHRWDAYYFFDQKFGKVLGHGWSGDAEDLALFFSGNCYRTKEEAMEKGRGVAIKLLEYWEAK